MRQSETLIELTARFRDEESSQRRDSTTMEPIGILFKRIFNFNADNLCQHPELDIKIKAELECIYAKMQDFCETKTTISFLKWENRNSALDIFNRNINSFISTIQREENYTFVRNDSPLYIFRTQGRPHAGDKLTDTKKSTLQETFTFLTSDNPIKEKQELRKLWGATCEIMTKLNLDNKKFASTAEFLDFYNFAFDVAFGPRNIMLTKMGIHSQLLKDLLLSSHSDIRKSELIGAPQEDNLPASDIKTINEAIKRKIIHVNRSLIGTPITQSAQDHHLTSMFYIPLMGMGKASACGGAGSEPLSGFDTSTSIPYIPESAAASSPALASKPAPFAPETSLRQRVNLPITNQPPAQAPVTNLGQRVNLPITNQPPVQAPQQNTRAEERSWLKLCCSRRKAGEKSCIIM